MLKGKTLIELTDVNTGKVERYEDENIITNAVQLYLNALATTQTIENFQACFPLWDSVFGGIKLFENSIEENVNNWHMPSLSKNKVIGYASADTSDGTDTRRGSRNLSETTVLENGVQIVWDFATSEANGNISCVCLTSAEGGKFPYGLNWSKTMRNYDYGSTDYYYLSALGYDESSKTFKLYNDKNYKIEENKIAFKDLKMDEPFAKFIRTLETSQTNIDNYTRDYRKKSYDFGDGYLTRIVKYDSATIRIEKHDKADYSLISSEDITFDTSLLAGSGYSEGNRRIIGGYLYFEAIGHDGYYKFDMSNPSNVVKIELPKSTTYTEDPALTELPNGDFATEQLFFNTDGSYDVFQSNISPKVSSSRVAPVIKVVEDDAFLITLEKSPGEGAGGFRILLNDMMLMSINNLETPVTKTADKTMKITYTLTYSE